MMMVSYMLVTMKLQAKFTYCKYIPLCSYLLNCLMLSVTLYVYLNSEIWSHVCICSNSSLSSVTALPGITHFPCTLVPPKAFLPNNWALLSHAVSESFSEEMDNYRLMSAFGYEFTVEHHFCMLLLNHSQVGGSTNMHTRIRCPFASSSLCIVF